MKWWLPIQYLLPRWVTAHETPHAYKLDVHFHSCVQDFRGKWLLLWCMQNLKAGYKAEVKVSILDCSR